MNTLQRLLQIGIVQPVLLPAGPPPIVFNHSTSSAAGDIVNIQGHNFTSASIVRLGLDASSVAMEAVNGVGTNALSVRVPQSVSSLIMARIWNGSTGSAPIYFNAARPHHIDATEIVPGGAFRIFGRSLRLAGLTPAVMVGGVSATIDFAASDEHMLVCVAGAGTVVSGGASVIVSNGNAAPAASLGRLVPVVARGTSDPLGIGLGWGAGFATAYATIIDSTSDSRLTTKVSASAADNGPAIKQAIILANSLGGGRVTLPAGALAVTSNFDLLSGCILEGQGRDSTTINYTCPYVIDAYQQDFIALRNLTMNAASTAATDGVNLKSSKHVVVQGCRFNTGTAHQFLFSNGQNTAFLNNIVNQTATLNGQSPMLFDNTAGLVITGNQVNWEFGVGLSLGRTSDAYIFGNTLLRDATRQATPNGNIVHSMTLDFARRIAVVGNTFNSTTPITDHTRNDGEQILCEAGGSFRTENMGTVTSATSTTFTDTNNTIVTDMFGEGSIPENYGVAIVAGLGVGQTRQVIGQSGKTLTISRAWDVTPDTTSIYSTFVWGLERALIKGNTIQNGSRGVWLYNANCRDVEIVGNTMTNNGGIYLRAIQQVAVKHLTGFWNVGVRGNTVTNTSNVWGSYANLVYVISNQVSGGLGTLAIGVEFKGNSLSSTTDSVDGEEYAGNQGYYQKVRVEGNVYDDYSPRLWGTIYQANSANGFDTIPAAFEFGTGVVGSTISAATVTNSTATYANIDAGYNATGKLAVGTVIE
jgi:hypothetical protein